MAKEKISELDAAAALTGAELVPIVQGGETVRTTAQAVADLAGAGTTVETTGTITGTAEVLVPCFPIPDTNAYSIIGSMIVQCTDAGAGTVVVGESAWWDLANSQIRNAAVVNTSDNTERETSMAEIIMALNDIASGQLRISITPPFDTAAADSEFSYKIRLSGFSL